MVLRLTHFNLQRAQDDQFINPHTQRLGRHFFSPYTQFAQRCANTVARSAARTMPTTTAGYGSYLPNAGK